MGGSFLSKAIEKVIVINLMLSYVLFLGTLVVAPIILIICICKVAFFVLTFTFWGGLVLWGIIGVVILKIIVLILNKIFNYKS